MVAIIDVVQAELGAPYTALVGGAIEFLALEQSTDYTEDQIIHFAWKAKHLVDTHRRALTAQPGFRQQHIVKAFLAGQSVQDWL